MAVQEDIKVKISALVSGLAEVKKLQSELQGLEKHAGKKLSVNTSGLEAGVGKVTALFRNLSSASDSSLSKLEGLGRAAGLSGSALGSIAGPAALAVAGIAAVGAAGVGLIGTLYNLAKSSAESTGKFIDLSQQTGFTVETLSTLDIGAQTSGGSIETLNSSLFIFTANMGEASGKSKELTKLFHENKISTNDIEKALRDAFAALNRLTDADDKATLAKKLFGKAAKDVISVLKETGGSLDDATAKFRDMGILITTDVAKAGDDAADKFRFFELQLERVKEKIGAQLTPTFLKFAEDLSEFLRSNPGEVRAWGNTVVSILGGVLVGFAKILGVVAKITGYVGSIGSTGPDLPTQPGLPAPPRYGPNVPQGYHLGPGSRLIPNTTTLPGPNVPQGFRLGPGGRLIPLKPGEGANDYLTGLRTRDNSLNFSGGGGGKEKETPEDRARQRLKELRLEVRQLLGQYDELEAAFKKSVETGTPLLDANTKATNENRAALELQGESFKDVNELTKQAYLAEARKKDGVEAATEALKKNIEKVRDASRESKACFAQTHEDLRQLVEGDKTASQSTDEFIDKLEKQGTPLNEAGVQFLRIVSLVRDMKKAVDDLDFSKFAGLRNISDPSGRGTPEDPFAHIFDGTPPPAQGKQDKTRTLLDDLKDFTKSDGLNQLVDALTAFGTGALSAKEAFREFALSVIQDIERMVIQFLVLAAVKAIAGVVGGGGGGTGGGIGGIGIGGYGLGLPGHADGGIIPAVSGGVPVLVGEGGYPEVIISADPKHLGRSQGLMEQFFAVSGFTAEDFMGGLSGRLSANALRGVMQTGNYRAAAGALALPTGDQQGGQTFNFYNKTSIHPPTQNSFGAFKQNEGAIHRDLSRAMMRAVKKLKD